MSQFEDMFNQLFGAPNPAAARKPAAPAEKPLPQIRGRWIEVDGVMTFYVVAKDVADAIEASAGAELKAKLQPLLFKLRRRA